ncbi:hypothetical protein BC835DRAFT_1322296 [Cytidiella melzeri]|nr:hypothetical protein BC835DRAFT_1322296 [Cytidiella melzeri]
MLESREKLPRPLYAPSSSNLSVKREASNTSPTVAMSMPGNTNTVQGSSRRIHNMLLESLTARAQVVWIDDQWTRRTAPPVSFNVPSKPPVLSGRTLGQSSETAVSPLAKGSLYLLVAGNQPLKLFLPKHRLRENVIPLISLSLLNSRRTLCRACPLILAIRVELARSSST